MVEPDQQKRRMNMEAAQEMRQMRTIWQEEGTDLCSISARIKESVKHGFLLISLFTHCPLLILVQLLSIVDPVHTLQKHLPSYNREGLL